ncbi:MAG: competence/damage-inducible protein A, partial [Actinomycetota bacterium]
MPTAAILVIGNEVLSGRTRDSHVQMLGGRLAAMGIRLAEARVVEDDADAIVAAVTDLRRRFDTVFTTGGIGPTHDDITAAAIARAFGVALVRNPEAVRRLEHHYGAEGLTDARLKMADIPEGATLIDNPVSQAPGFTIGNVHVLAGIPRIAEAMFESLRPSLTGGPPVIARTRTMWVGERMLAAARAEVPAVHPAVQLGSY